MMSSFKEIPGFHHPGAVDRMQYVRFGPTDMHVSKAGLGGIALSLAPINDEFCSYGDIKEQEAINLVHESLKRGVNFLDTAYWYGQGASERFLGKALKGIPREAYYISTKLGEYEPDLATKFDYTYERTVRGIDEALERLGLSYIDIIFAHDIEYTFHTADRPTIINGALRALNEAREADKIGHIGICGYMFKPLIETLRDSPYPIDAIINYGRATLFNDELTAALPQLKRGLDGKTPAIINGSPTGAGILTPACIIQPWNPASDELKEKCKKAVKYCNDEGVNIARLANHYASHFPGVDVMLMGATSQPILESCLDAVLVPLTGKEKAVMGKVVEMLGGDDRAKNNWEGREVAAYKKATGK